MADFKEELVAKSNRINEELKKYLKKDECPEKILNEAVEYSLMAGGKRIRPVLIMSTYELFRNDIEMFPGSLSSDLPAVLLK